MNELISLTQSAINGELQQTVNARELHAFLEVGRDFSNWIKARLETLGSIKNEDYLLAKIGEQYDFVENQDFITAPQKNGAFKNRSDGY